MVRRTLTLTCLVGCAWVDEDAGRLDQDHDNYPVHLDCNDNSKSVSTMEAWDGEIRCGDSVAGDARDGQDLLRIVNCIHPTQRDDLVLLGNREHVYRFSSEVATDVEIKLYTESFLIAVHDRDTAGVALIANRGDTCELDSCEVGLPLAPKRFRNDIPLAERPEWTPELVFHAEAGEGWFVTVSGGRDDLPSPFTLDVRCLL